ncbi:MAG TPA: YbaK/EbsC family protein [Solirubrobacteraceae bacterium]
MGGPGSPQGVDAARELLDRARVRYEVVEHDETFRALDEAQATGVEPREAAKTVALRDHDAYVLAVVPANRRLDVARARALIGASRHLRLATEEELARDFPEFEVGALPPLAPHATPEIVDVHLLYRERIVCSAGDHRHAVRLDPRDLLRVCEPRVGDVCEREEGASPFRDLPHV